MVARLRISTRVEGPIFDGRADRAASDFARDLEETGAEMALRSIRRTYHTEFRNPTGFYEGHVRISNEMGGPVVHDGGTISYGPWLEGIESRNAHTRFRGYGAFRKAAVQLERRIEEMGYRLLASRYIRRMD